MAQLKAGTTIDGRDVMLEIDNLNEEVIAHKNDDMQHGIGDKTTLKTTEKTTIVGAINELVTGKQNTLNADQIRKITLSTENPSGGSDGDIWIKYKA